MMPRPSPAWTGMLVVVVCLSGVAGAQATYSGGASWTGGGIWGTGSQNGLNGDLPLPDFTQQGGVALSLPQAWVDPMEPFVQSVDNTIYIGNTSNGCPTAPARTNYKNQARSAGQCDFYDATGAGLNQVAQDWAKLSGGTYDQRWDVVVTHGSSYSFGNSPWTWATKYNGSVPSKYLVYHSDCTSSTPCTGTNDLGYNPPGRQVCSHGINDMVSPPLPSMGQRNHGCQGYLGFVGVDYQIPIPTLSPSSPGPYTYDSGYNDLANMFTITSTVNIGVSQITMGAASTQGGVNQCDGAGGAGTNPCPTEGVNHIWLTDAHLVTGEDPTNNGRTNTPVSFKAAEWGALSPTVYLGATPNHIGLSQVYFDGSTDDDGFGTQKIQRAIMMSCSYCGLTHSYIDGLKSDGKENHGISTDDAPGPVMIVDNWCEGSSGCYWGGGGNTPAVAALDGTNIEFRRNRLPYEQRWMPAPAGNQTIKKSISGGSCSGTTLSLNLSNGSNAVTNANAVYLSKIKDAGGNGVCGGGANTCEGWYAASALDSTHVAVTVSTCSNTPASGSVYGFANNYLGAVNVTASAMNAASKDPTMNNPVLKNRWESKDYKQVLADGIVIEHSAVDGQSGEGVLNGIRGYSGVAYDSGGETATIQDLTLTNFICRHSTECMNLAARSGGYSLGTYPVTNINCNGTTSATVTATGLNGAMLKPPTFLPDYSLNCSNPNPGTVIVAASCASSDVQAALNQVTTDSVTVIVPTGSCTWSTPVTPPCQSVTLQGGGNGTDPAANTVIAVNGGSVPWNCPDKTLRVTNFHFNVSTAYAFNVGGGERNAHDTSFRYDHNFFGNTTSGMLRLMQFNGHCVSPGCVFDSNTLHNLGFLIEDQEPTDASHNYPGTSTACGVDKCYGSTVWNRDPSVDGWDTATQRPDTWTPLYFENNAITQDASLNSQDFLDCQDGGKYVFRYNTVVGNDVFDHGFDSVNSCYEVTAYGNNHTSNGQGHVLYRGGNGVVYQNLMNTTTGFYDNGIILINYRSTNTFHAPGDLANHICDGSDAADQNQSGQSGYACFQEPGRGAGTNAWNGGSTTYSSPIYEWDNCKGTSLGCTGTSNQVTAHVETYTGGTSDSHVIENRDYYDSQSTGCSGTQTAGVCIGTLASRAANCTAGVAYWATDVSNGNGGTNSLGLLYKCTSTDTWSSYYVPFTYPHPLTVGGGGGICAGADVYLTGIGSGLIPDAWYTTSYPTQGDYGKDSNITIWANQAHTGSVCTVNNGTTTTGTVYGVKGSNGNGVSKPSRRIVYQNGLIYGIGDHGLSNGSGNVNFGGAGGNGNNYTMQITVNADGVTATAVSQSINVCAASNECPRVLQAQVGDLAYMICPNDDRFDAIDATNPLKGTPMLSVSSDQLSFTYTLNAANHNQLQPGNTLTCSLAPPTSSLNSGYYINQSFPWPMVLNHLTAVGVNGFNWGLGTYNPYNTFTNSLQLVPGANDVYAGDNCSGGTSTNCKYGLTGGVVPSETYHSDDSAGLTYGNDRNTTTVKSWAASTRNIHNYLTFPCGNPPSSGCDTGGNPSTAGTNSTPTNVATSGASVTCNSGSNCDPTHYTPDSVGFLGSMNTTNYPFLLSDWRNYALHSSSPYKAGGILDATDGLDGGAQIPLIVNALSRTLYVCGLPCGGGPHHDGPQYGFLQWSPYGGAVNYRVYRDGGGTPVGTVTTTWFNDYGLANGGHTWTVKAWDGSAEHDVPGLSSQIY